MSGGQFSGLSSASGLERVAIPMLRLPPTGGEFKRQCQAVFPIRIQLNPDPAKNLNPDPNPEDLESLKHFLKKKMLLLHNYKIFSSKEVN